MGKLDGKVVVVTGASRGIGAEIARVFAAEGGKVVCGARTLREGDHPLEGSLETTVAQIRGAGGEASPSTVNISLPEDCERLLEEARDAYGPVDVLVNNAALTYFIPIKDYPVNRWMRSWAGELSRAVHAEPARAAGHDTAPEWQHREHILRRSHRPRQRPLPQRSWEQRRNMLRRGEGRPRTLQPGSCARGVPIWHLVTCVSPSQVVPTPGTVFHNLVSGIDDPRGEPVELMAKSSLLLATEPLDSVTGRVTYSQQILKEFGWISEAKGTGVDEARPGSGYSQV